MKKRLRHRAFCEIPATLVLAGGVCFAEIIPPDRLMAWGPGVPGGIAQRATVGAAVDAVKYGTGATDASNAIGAAIDACPAGQVVFIPAGTYRIDNRIYRAGANTITIRGAGTGATILKAGAAISQMLLLGSSDWPRPTSGAAITAGATKGSTVLTLGSATGFTTGKLVRIEQDDLPYVISRDAPDVNNRLLSAVFKATAVTPTTVTVTPPLPFTFVNSPRLVQYSIGPIAGAGVEDLTLDADSLCGIPLQFEQAWGCWVKNVEVKNSTSRQIFFTCFSAGEVRHNFAHDVIGGGPNHEGLDFYQDCSFNLIEDNITYNGGFPGIILGDSKGGCTGNVIAYNFCYAANVGDPSMAGMDISVSHGPHNLMNLVEGNIAGGMGSDGYFGSTSHITVVRNWFTATHPTAADNLIAVNVGRWNTFFNLVGNILGTSSFAGSGLFQPENPFGYQTPVICKLGFPNMGNNGFTGAWGPSTPPSYVGQAAHQAGTNSLQELDLNVKATMVRHGNYDYLNKSIAWDAAIEDRTIPVSYFRTVKPAFFGNLAWPPFDPASPPGALSDANISRIPAGYRYVHGVDPAGIARPRMPAGSRRNDISPCAIYDILGKKIGSPVPGGNHRAGAMFVAVGQRNPRAAEKIIVLR